MFQRGEFIFGVADVWRIIRNNETGKLFSLYISSISKVVILADLSGDFEVDFLYAQKSTTDVTCPQ